MLKFLERKCKEAEKEIEEKGTLSDDNAIHRLLKTQFNHIAHLNKELSVLRNIIDKKFDKVYTVLIIGFIILGFLIVLFGFLK